MARFEITHTQISGSRSLALSASEGLYKDADRLRKAAELLRGQSGFGVSEVQSLITRAASNTMRHAGNAETTAAFLFDLESVVTHRESNALRIMQGATVEDYTAGYSFAGVNWPVPSANLPVINIPGIHNLAEVSEVFFALAEWLTGVAGDIDAMDAFYDLLNGKTGTAVGPVDILLGVFENFLEHRELNGRFVQETVTEIMADVAVYTMIELAVTGIGAGLVAAGVITAAPAVAVAAVATVIFIGVDKLVEHFSGKDIAEHISDFIWDNVEKMQNEAAERAKEAAGNASNSVKDAFNAATNCFNNPQNNIIPKWAPAMAA